MCIYLFTLSAFQSYPGAKLFVFRKCVSKTRPIVMFTSVSNTYLVPNSASKNCNTCFDCLCNLKINKCEIYKCVQLITNYIRGIFVQKVSLQIDRVPYWVTGR